MSYEKYMVKIKNRVKQVQCDPSVKVYVFFWALFNGKTTFTVDMCHIVIVWAMKDIWFRLKVGLNRAKFTGIQEDVGGVSLMK